jgi:hypothetical protein
VDEEQRGAPGAPNAAAVAFSFSVADSPMDRATLLMVMSVSLRSLLLPAYLGAMRKKQTNLSIGLARVNSGGCGACGG